MADDSKEYAVMKNVTDNSEKYEGMKNMTDASETLSGMKNRAVLKIIMSLCLAAAALIILAFGALYISEVFLDKDLPGKSKRLIQAETDYDIILMGSSHIGAVIPQEMWREAGLSTYNLYFDGNSMPRNLAILKLALDYVSPKLVVLDIESWWQDAEFSEELGTFHHALDTFPLTPHKAELIGELTADRKERTELLVPFYRYHSRWPELMKSDFQKQEDVFLGSHLTGMGVMQLEEPARVAAEEYLPGDDKDPGPVLAIIEECRKRGIELCFTCVPHVATEKHQRRYHNLEAWAQQYGVKTINFLDMDRPVDYACDFSNAGHLNLNGAVKTSRILASELAEKYPYLDRRAEADNAAVWDRYFEEYYRQIRAAAHTAQSVENALVLISHDALSGEIYLKASSYANGAVDALMRNLLKGHTENYDRAVSSGGDYLLIINKREGSLQEYVGSEAETAAGGLGEGETAYVMLRDSGTQEVIEEYRF